MRCDRVAAMKENENFASELDAQRESTLPSWGPMMEFAIGSVCNYSQEPHHDTFVTRRHIAVVNLTYDRTQIAIDSDRLEPLVTPRDCVVFVPAGTDVTEVYDGNGEAIMLDIASEQYEKLVEQDVAPTSNALRYRNDIHDSVASALADSIRRQFFRGPRADRLAVESALVSLQDRLFHALGNRRQTGAGRKLTVGEVGNVLDFIEAHHSESVSLSDLASVLNMSPHHFARAFKRATGVTPYRRVIESRLRLVRNLLVSTQQPLSDIAIDAGFSSQAHMTDVFRRELGTTPASYRRDINP